jgi:asparagine synthase (glutamine-hydrolysing)
MCGIAGIYHLDGKPVDPGKLKAMTDIIRHRGPDDEGYLLVNTKANKSRHYAGEDTIPELKATLPQLNQDIAANLGFGFRRLSILDLSSHGHQPMSYQKDDLWIVYNGEIYNYIELKRELISLGQVFATGTDTEVILAAYRQWGTSCLNRLNGMWSFAIWDKKNTQLFCARDRFGVKPFNYYYDGKIFVFGSEVKQLLSFLPNQDVNNKMIYRSLKMGSFLCYGNETFFNDIKVLEHSHFMIIKDGKINLKQYYDLDQKSFETSQLSFEQACEQYRSIFEDSVRLRLRSDVEVGSCLSGGLDSSAIVCTAHQQNKQSLQTFSAYFERPIEIDERKWIRIVNEYSGSKEHLISPNPADVLADLSKITWHHDTPLVGSSPVIQYYVMEAARKNGVTVILDGQGSDEITAGYNHAFYRYYADLIMRGKWHLLSNQILPYLEYQQKGNPISKLMRILITLLMSESSLYKNEIKHNVPNVMNLDFKGREIFPHLKDMKHGKLSNFLYNLVMTIFLQTLLHFEDRNSMAWSIESRVPFLDYRLVEFAFSLPDEYKINGQYGKYVHRKALEKIVPRPIVERKDKVNFAAPGEGFWLKNEFRRFYDDMLHDTQFKNRGIFDVPKIRRLYNDYLNGDNRYSSLLWKIMATEIWFRVSTQQLKN